MHRFHIAADSLRTEQVILPADTAHQLVRVLRLRAGARIVLFGGDGTECDAVIEALDARGAAARITGWRTPDVELGCRLHVALAVLKGEKLDWAVQKLTELGAAQISLMATERTVVTAGEERWPRRLERLARIAREAAEQCGRVRLPVVAEPRGMPHLLAEREGARFILSPCADEALSAVLRPCPPSVTLFIGPEGGFSDSEHGAALDSGARAVSMGRRTLRAETAAIAAAAIVAAASES